MHLWHCFRGSRSLLVATSLRFTDGTFRLLLNVDVWRSCTVTHLPKFGNAMWLVAWHASMIT
jgi:hypothetical protein